MTTTLNDTIRAVFLAHGFTIKDGQTDLKPYVYEAVHALLSKLRAPKPLGDSCHHCGWTDWVSQDGAAYCQACGKPHGSVPAEGLPNLPQLLREDADLDEAEGGNAQVCALERDAADEIERLRREVAKLRAPVADEREAFEAAIHDEYGTSAASMLLRDADGDYVTMNTEWVFWLKRAALTSAPVADERVRKALQTLVDMYVLNQGSDHEHITCYTPLPASHLTPKQRAKSEAWKAWDDARAALTSAPVADESPMAKMADALREKGRQEQQAYQDSRVQSTEWGPMPHGTEADLPASAPVAGEADNTDYIGLALELESAAKRVESQTVQRAIEAGAHGLRLAYSFRNAAPQASEAELKEAAAMARSFGAPDMADALEGRASEADALIDALGQCRDAFPIPDIVGSKLDFLWQEAMSDPSAVPAYIKARAALSAQPGAQRTGDQ